MELPAQIAAEVASADALQEQLSGAQAVPQDTQLTQEPVAEAVKEPTVDEEAAKLRNRYNSLRGKYDAEVPRLNQTVKDLEAQLQAAREENVKLHEAAVASQGKVGLTDNDVEVYGEDMVDMVRRGASENIGPMKAETARMKAEIEQLKAQVKASQDATAEAGTRDFTRVLDSEIPSWREQNEDPEFLEWLKSPIPGYGMPRQIALDGAVRGLDANAVVGIFKEFQQEKKARSNGLNRQVQPDYTKRGARPAGTTPTSWTQAKVAQFYDRARRGEFTQEQFEQLENELNGVLEKNNGRLPPY